MVQVKNKRERPEPEWPPGDGEASRLGSRDPVADGIECGSHGGKNGQGNVDKEPVRGGG